METLKIPYIIFWIVAIIQTALLITGEPRFSVLFGTVMFLCLGYVLGWHLAGKGEGGE